MKKQQLIFIGSALFLGGVLLGLLFSANNKTSEIPENHHHEKIKENQEKTPQKWTCSMHPQIQKNEPGQCPICGMVLIPSKKYSGSVHLEMTEEAAKLANIQTTEVVYGNTEKTHSRLSGKLYADETRVSSVVTHIPGRIEKLFLHSEGEKVKKGQRIALIYSPALITAQKELLEAKKLAQTTPELLEAAKNKLRYWKVPKRIINEIITSNQVKEYFNIYSDYKGTISKFNVSIGDHLMKGESLFQLQDLSKLWAIFEVYEQNLARVDIGDTITFSALALPGRSFESTISFLYPTVDLKTHIVNIRTEVNNPYGYLRPGMILKGVLASEINDDNLVVPKSAVLWTGKRSVVYVKVPRANVPSFEYREVVLGDAIGDYYTIYEGIYQGERVVTNGAFVIDSSSQLNNSSSMINRHIELRSTKNKEHNILNKIE